MSVALIRPLAAIRWELRKAWASGTRVALTIDGAERVEGHVDHVAASGLYVLVSGTHVPCDMILAVHTPSLLGDSTWDWTLAAWWAKPKRWEPQRERLWYDDAEVA